MIKLSIPFLLFFVNSVFVGQAAEQQKTIEQKIWHFIEKDMMNVGSCVSVGLGVMGICAFGRLVRNNYVSLLFTKQIRQDTTPMSINDLLGTCASGDLSRVTVSVALIVLPFVVHWFIKKHKRAHTIKESKESVLYS